MLDVLYYYLFGPTSRLTVKNPDVVPCSTKDSYPKLCTDPTIYSSQLLDCKENNSISSISPREELGARSAYFLFRLCNCATFVYTVGVNPVNP